MVGTEQIMPRETIEPHKGAKRYVRRGLRRGPKGRFTDKQVSVGRSLSADRRSKAKTVVKKGRRRSRGPAKFHGKGIGWLQVALASLVLVVIFGCAVDLLYVWATR